VAVSVPPAALAMAPAAFSARTRLLVVAPHPDDETIANGLLIRQVRAAGGEVGIVLLTDGDNNPWPQRWIEHRLRIDADGRRRWGARRYAELLLAMDRLGLPAEALQRLHWPDLGVTAHLLSAPGEAVAAVAATLTAFRPDIVVAPAMEDRHPDHGAAHVLVRLALARMPAPPTLWSYVVHGPQNGEPVLRIEGSLAQQAAKRHALSAHRSQLALSGGRVQRLSGRPEQFFAGASCRTAPDHALPWRPPALLHPWLRLSLASAAGARRWRWREAPIRRDASGAYRLTARDEAEDAPRFAHLALAIPSPWIFDHWGWCEL
jgi:LmbE family N-acetylglucosaminyl deacetylase